MLLNLLNVEGIKRMDLVKYMYGNLFWLLSNL